MGVIRGNAAACCQVSRGIYYPDMPETCSHATGSKKTQQVKSARRTQAEGHQKRYRDLRRFRWATPSEV